MKLVLLLLLLVINLFGQKVLVINSNTSIEKYNSAQKSFEAQYIGSFSKIDISKMTHDEVRNYLYDEYPDIIYAIGSTAYQYASKYIPEKKIFFSSIVNYNRLDLSANTFGVSNEVYSGMEITFIKTMFPKIKRLKLIYSKYTKDIYKDYKKMSKVSDMKVFGERKSKLSMNELEAFFENTDAFVLLPDPLLIKDESFVKRLFKISKKTKKPIFVYHELFLKYGALLSISVDNPTIGRQIATMVNREINNSLYKKIQMPMGTNIVLNKKVLDLYGTNYNKFIYSQVNKVIE